MKLGLNMNLQLEVLDVVEAPVELAEAIALVELGIIIGLVVT